LGYFESTGMFHYVITFFSEKAQKMGHEK
jgi:hypothetical protein